MRNQLIRRKVEHIRELQAEVAALRQELEGDGSASSDPLKSLGLRECLQLQAENIAELKQQLAALRQERARIQRDFCDSFGDRDGNFYEQVKDLVAQFYAEREQLEQATQQLTTLRAALQEIFRVAQYDGDAIIYRIAEQALTPIGGP